MSVYLAQDEPLQTTTTTRYDSSIRWKVGLNKISLLQSMVKNSDNNLLTQGDLWSKMGELLKKTYRPAPYIVVRFRDHIRVSAFFLRSFLSNDWKMVMEMTIEFEAKKWTFDFNINSQGVGVEWKIKRLGRELKSEFKKALLSGKAKITVKLTFQGMIKTIIATSPPDQTTQVVRKLLEEQIQSDMQLVAKNGTELFPCHKAFLAGHSSWFDLSFRMEPEKEVWEVNMTEEGLSAFLKYVYYADTEVPKKNLKIAMELLKIGKEYQIALLEKEMKTLLLEVETSAMGVEIALELFCFTRKEKGWEELKAKAINLLNWNSTKVSKSYTLQSIVKGDEDTITELDSIGLY
ncbi:unnamed protein product [Orchesella dallaii]|uniref:BTB domain-containing protein n=1 Tax=Orchesella dallaii TaxID=48710 RepID=A0ABP1RAS3_9HEXA